MRVDILGLEAFIAIAEQGSFRKAAATLHITQTALTRRLQNLESLLDVRLVERTTRSVTLAPVGRDFLPQARRLCSELATALFEIRETGRAQRGHVSIACVPTVGVQYLPRVIEEYSARYPDNRIQILDHSSFGVAQSVLRREAEFGIHIGGGHHPELVSAPLFEDRFVVVCRTDHTLAAAKQVTWQQLEAHPLIFVGAESGNRPLVDAAVSAGKVRLQAHYEVQRSSTALGLVAAGVAAAIVPSLAIQKGTYPTLRVKALTRPVVSRSLELLSRKGAQLSPAAEALYDLIVRRAKSNLAAPTSG